MNELAALATEVDLRLREKTDPKRQEFTRGYFPSAMENLGVAVPHVRKVARDVARRLKSSPPGQAIDFARLVLAQNTLEGRQAAYLVLALHPDHPAFLKRAVLEELGKGMDNWTSVDTFACDLSGPAWRVGALSDRAVQAWAKGRDLWWRRAAVVSTVALNLASRGGEGDAPRTLAMCEELATDPEPMVAKGLSWALRSLIGHDPQGVERFLRKHREHLPRLVLREVQNKLETGLKTPGKAAGVRKKA